MRVPNPPCATLEALTEPAGVLGWVAKGQPEALGVLVGEEALGGFPDDVFDLGGFIEDHELALAAVVKTGEGLRVGLGPGDHVDAPSAFALGVFGHEGGGVEDEEFASEEAEVEPTAEFGPGLRLKLHFSVGGDDTLGIRVSHHGPEEDHGDKGGFANAVAGRGGALHCRLGGEQAEAEVFKDLTLPFERSGIVGENSAGATPRECTEAERERVVADGGEPGDEFSVHGDDRISERLFPALGPFPEIDSPRRSVVHWGNHIGKPATWFPLSEPAARWRRREDRGPGGRFSWGRGERRRSGGAID